MADNEFLSTRQAAQRLGVSLGTVQNMVESGVLDAWKTAGGHRRIPASSVEALLAKRRKQIARPGEASGQLDILVAEDDPTLQKLYQMTFDSWKLPITLRIVGDGFEMIRRLRTMPDLSSMDIIVVSAIDADEIRERGMPADVTVFAKPIPFHELKGFVLGRLAARQRS